MGKPKIKKNQEKLNDALRLIKNGLSINKAASLHKVSVSTLWRRKKGIKLQVSGSKPHLSSEDEKVLLKYAEFVANMGSPVTVNWMRIMAGRLANKRCV